MSATVRTMRANAVRIKPRSTRIREITGMLVTAIPHENTMSSDVWFAAEPIKPPGLSTSKKAAPAANGMRLPISAISDVVRPSPRRRWDRRVAPAQYIRSNCPSW